MRISSLLHFAVFIESRFFDVKKTVLGFELKFELNFKFKSMYHFILLLFIESSIFVNMAEIDTLIVQRYDD